jgi:anti-sigma factor RsiW
MTQSAHLTCREFNDFVMDYLSSELPGETRAHFDQHLKDCPNCVRYLETYRTTIVIGRIAFDSLESVAPAEVPEELIQAILSAQRQS